MISGLLALSYNFLSREGIYENFVNNDKLLSLGTVKSKFLPVDLSFYQ